VANFFGPPCRIPGTYIYCETLIGVVTYQTVTLAITLNHLSWSFVSLIISKHWTTEIQAKLKCGAFMLAGRTSRVVHKRNVALANFQW